MALLAALFAQTLHVVLMLAAAPLLVGGLRRWQARLLGRAGPPLLQPYLDLSRLARKHPVVADNASWVFTGAPAVSFAATLAAAALVPSFALGMATAPLADLLVVAGLLALARCTLALAGMDVGTAFGGMGASRTISVATLAEPALLLVVFTLALLCGGTNLDAIAVVLRDGGPGPRVALGLAMAALLVVALADTGRMPVGQPATRRELAMLHDAVALEYSGRHLALIEWGAALRLLIWLTLIAGIFVPFGVADAAGSLLWWPLGLLAWIVKLAVLASALGVAESVVAQRRASRVAELLGIAMLLGALALVFVLVGQGFT